MDKVKKQIYQNVIDSLCLANNYRTSDYLIPDKYSDKVLEEMTYRLVSLLRDKKGPFAQVLSEKKIDYSTLYDELKYDV